MVYQTNYKNTRPYFENKGKTTEKKINDIELFQDYFRILGLNSNAPHKTVKLDKARHKAIFDYGNESSKADFINKAFEILSDNTIYEFELTSKKKPSIIVNLTPRAFYLKQKQNDFDPKSTDNMLDALSKRQLTLIELQEYIRDGAKISEHLASCIKYTQEIKNNDMLFFIIDYVLTKKDLEDLAKNKETVSAVNNLLFNDSLRAYLTKFLKNGADPKTVNSQGVQRQL